MGTVKYKGIGRYDTSWVDPFGAAPMKKEGEAIDYDVGLPFFSMRHPSNESEKHEIEVDFNGDK